MHPGGSHQGDHCDTVLNVSGGEQRMARSVIESHHVFSATIGKGPPAPHHLRGPESCPNPRQPADSVAVDPDLLVLAASGRFPSILRRRMEGSLAYDCGLNF